MSKQWGWLLALGLAGCSQQVEVAPEIALKHHYDASFRQQVQLLGAEQVRVSASPVAAGGGPAVLTLEVRNPQGTPQQTPDTLRQRVHKLAHLLVADLASPDRYQAVNVQASFKGSRFSLATSSDAQMQMFIYSTASLR